MIQTLEKIIKKIKLDIKELNKLKNNIVEVQRNKNDGFIHHKGRNKNYKQTMEEVISSFL